MEEIIPFIKSKFKDGILNLTEDERFSITVKEEKFYEVLTELKEHGFGHLSDVTCVDYIEEDEFEVIYHLWSHTRGRRGNVKVRIPRDSASIKSVSDLWPSAQMHERENHELFGVTFVGNPDLSPLFLDDWTEIPPLRKDFNSREFVKRKYYEESENR